MPAVEARASGATRWTRDSRSLVMICENDASPCISSASPGAFGSTETAAIVGENAARSTTTIFAWRAISRASVSAVSVMLSLGAVPNTVTLWAPAPARQRSSASCSTSPTAVTASAVPSLNTGSG